MEWKIEVPDGLYKVIVEYYDPYNNFFSDIFVNGKPAFHEFNTFGFGQAQLVILKIHFAKNFNLFFLLLDSFC